MDYLKKITLVIFIAGFLSILLFWYLNHKLSPEYLKKLLTVQISQLSHKTTEIHGDVKWKMFPSPEVIVHEVELGDKKKIQDYYLKMDAIKLRLQLSALLLGKIRFNEIKLNGAHAKIHQLPEQQKTVSNPKTKKQSSQTPGDFAIDELNISDSSIEIMDGNGSLLLSDVKLKVNEFSLHSSRFPVHMKGRISSSYPENNIDTRFQFNGHIKISENAVKNHDISTIELDGKLTGKDLKFGQFKVDSFEADSRFNKGILNLSPLLINMYSSQSKGDLSIDLNKMSATLSQNASNLNAENFLNDTVDVKFIKGKLDYQLSAYLSLRQPDISKIAAKGQISIREGKVQGIDVEYLMNELSALIMPINLHETALLEQGLKLANFNVEKFNTGFTAFNLASLSWQLNGGMLRSDNIILTSEKLDIRGQGQVDLIHNQLNSQLQAKFKDYSKNSKIYLTQEVLGGSFPVIISGDLSHPRLTPDLRVLNPLIKKLFVKKTVDKSVKFLKSQIKSIFK